MFIIREIFHLQFGRYREARALIDEAMQKHLLLQPQGSRLLTDFTGEGYRLILELPYETLTAYEADLKKELGAAAWKDWYERFKANVRHSEREILKQVM
ncbi:hypothetical protein GZH53_03500 [Flavihumibacter sp. R14]|nr:hypothetical protein [Flavihumibacter soli]